MMDTTTLGTTDDTPTLPMSASSSTPLQSPERDDEFAAATARLVPKVSGILPDDVIHAYVHFRRTQIRLRKLVSASKRKIVANRRKIRAYQLAILSAQDNITEINVDIDEKQHDVKRYEEGLSGAKTICRLIEEGEFTVKRPRIFGLSQNEDN